MDPQQTAAYAKAHDELRDLFREIARHGRVTAHELQHALLPFTAGDAKRDLQELVDEMKRKQTTLDEPDFIRTIWKKMYLSNVVYTTQHTAGRIRPASAGTKGRHGPLGGNDGGEPAQAINIPLAHVIVSIKRRAQLKQFANYYASRGISGADHLNAAGDALNTDRSTPRHLLHAQKKRQAAAAAAAQAASITALRARTTSRYDVVAYGYDTVALCMKAHRLFTDVEMATVSNCSRLHCVVSTKGTGSLLVGSRHFIDQVRARAMLLDNELEEQEMGDDEIHQATPEPVLINGTVPKDFYLVKLDDLGLRNITALGVGRGTIVATTERRVHCWTAFDARVTAAAETAPTAQTKPVKALSPENAKPVERTIPLEVIEFLEDEGDCFGHVPLLKRAKTVSDVAGIRQVACGDRFAIGVTATSELYAWGTAPLGRGKTVPSRLPVFSAADSPIVVSRVVCGLHHVLLLASHGSVFAWGSNVHGQLGVSPQGSALNAAVQEPTEVGLRSFVLDIACGDHHSVVLTDKGALFAWGNNWHGQLGLDPTLTETGSMFAPTKVSWWTNLGNGHERHDEDASSPERQSQATATSSPTKLAAAAAPPPRVYLLTAVGDTTAIVTEHGHIYVWGKCVSPGPFAGACGIVAHWTPQRVDLPNELVADDRHSGLNANGTEDSDATRCLESPWHSIAIANGLVLLTRHAASA